MNTGESLQGQVSYARAGAIVIVKSTNSKRTFRPRRFAIPLNMGHLGWPIQEYCQAAETV